MSAEPQTMPDSVIEAVVAGHICLDITPGFGSREGADPAGLFAPGTLVRLEGVSISTGGAVSNTGIALSLLGVGTRLMGKIGDDYFGDGVLRVLSRHGLAEGMMVARGERTSYTVVVAPPGTDRMFLHDPGANDTFSADDVDYETVSTARLFHFGYPPLMKRMYEGGGAELVKLFRRVKELGVTTSLDMTLPDAASEAGRADWHALLRELLPFVDVFTPSVEELLFMVDRAAFDALDAHRGSGDVLERLDLNALPRLGAALLSCGVKVALVKCGVKGCYLRTAGREQLAQMGGAAPADAGDWAERELLAEAFQVDRVASTTGAGDAAAAGFLAALLRGRPAEDALRVACAVGAQSVTRTDSFSGVRPLAETVAWLARERPRQWPLAVPRGHWRRHGAPGLWVGAGGCDAEDGL